MSLMQRMFDYFIRPTPKKEIECKYQIFLKNGKNNIFLFAKVIYESTNYTITGDDILIHFELKNTADCMYEYCYHNAPRTFNEIYLYYFGKKVRSVLKDRWEQHKIDYTV